MRGAGDACDHLTAAALTADESGGRARPDVILTLKAN
jgi:hypothetical protein